MSDITPPPPVPLKRLWREFLQPLIKPHRNRLWTVLFLLLCAAVCVLAVGNSLRMLFGGQKNVEGLHVHSIAQAFGTTAALILVILLSNYGRIYILHIVGDQVVATIRKQLFAHLIHGDPVQFEALSTAAINGRIVTDTMIIQGIIMGSLPQALLNMILFIGAVILLGTTSWSLTSRLLLLFPFLGLILYYFGPRLRLLATEAQMALNTMGIFCESVFLDMRSTHILCQENRLEHIFKDYVAEAIQRNRRLAQTKARFTACILLFVLIDLIFVTLYGIQAIDQGALSAGHLSAFLFYAITIVTVSGSLSENYTEAQRFLGACTRLFRMLHMPRLIPHSEAPLAPSPHRELCLDHVSFAYPTRPQITVLDDISLTIPSGQKVGIVSTSGGGKSTIQLLLLRLYEVTQGQILLNHTPITQMPLPELRRTVGYVSNDPLIFHGTLRDNLTCGLPATDPELIALCDRLNPAFLPSLEEGLDTLLGLKGWRISGTQRLLVGLARALLRKPTIFLLDDITTGLDHETSTSFLSTLEQEAAGCTLLMTTHNVSLLKRLDRIVCLHQGKIVADGPHDTLINIAPLYRKIVGIDPS